MNIIPKKAKETFQLYYDDDREIYIIDYYVNKSLPLNGWLKPCVNCYTITSKYFMFNYNDRKIEISLCNQCDIKKKKIYKRIYRLMDIIKEENKLNKYCKICLC